MATTTTCHAVHTFISIRARRRCSGAVDFPLYLDTVTVVSNIGTPPAMLDAAEGAWECVCWTVGYPGRCLGRGIGRCFIVVVSAGRLGR